MWLVAHRDYKFIFLWLMPLKCGSQNVLACTGFFAGVLVAVVSSMLQKPAKTEHALTIYPHFCGKYTRCLNVFHQLRSMSYCCGVFFH